MKNYLGIDFGTTNSVVCLNKRNYYELLSCKQNGTEIPSVVFYQDGLLKVNEYGCQKGATALRNVKRLIGKRFDDIDDHSHDKSLYGTDIVRGSDGFCTYAIDGHQYSCIDIAAELFRYFKSLVYKRVEDEGIESTFISVPANYNTTQRQHICEAARKAGIDNFSLLNEPTAACMAFGRDQYVRGNVVFVDLGGGTLDISTIEVTSDGYNVISTHGNPSLGGADFTKAMMEMIKDTIKKECDIDIFERKSEIEIRKIEGKLWNEAEKAKIILSSVMSCDIDLSPFTNYEYDDCVIITRSAFQPYIQSLVMRCHYEVMKALELSGLENKDIDYVLLVGGGSHIPYLQQIIENGNVGKAVIYAGKKDNTGLNIDVQFAMQGVAKGCCNCASKMSNPAVRVRDRLHSAIAIKCVSGNIAQQSSNSIPLGYQPYEMVEIFPRNTLFGGEPVRRVFYCEKPGMTVFQTCLYEKTSDGLYHEFLQITSQRFAPDPIAHKQLQFTFRLTLDGQLYVECMVDNRSCLCTVMPFIRTYCVF